MARGSAAALALLALLFAYADGRMEPRPGEGQLGASLCSGVRATGGEQLGSLFLRASAPIPAPMPQATAPSWRASLGTAALLGAGTLLAVVVRRRRGGW